MREIDTETNRLAAVVESCIPSVEAESVKVSLQGVADRLKQIGANPEEPVY
jgi:hypothetical protein